MLNFFTENIFYVIIVSLVLLVSYLLVKLLSFKYSKKETLLLQEIQELQNEKQNIEDSCKNLKKKIKKLDERTKTSFVSDQIEKIEMMQEKIELYQKRADDAKLIAQEAMNVKYEFLSNIRHEIRTPMNSVLTFADMLAHEIKNPTHRSYANNILVSGRKLLTLMDDIIDLSHLERGTFEIQKRAIDVKLLFNSIVQDFQKSANTKGLKLTLNIDKSMPDSLIVDDEKIAEILSHLIDNAIKFTSAGFVDVEVMVDKYNRMKNIIDISMHVKDSGIGIDSAYHQQIFEIFEKRENANDTEFQGKGLGLSINKKVAKMMHGDIFIKSKVGEGSSFVFSLTGIEVILLNASESVDESSIDFSVIRPEGARIMVIDEDEESRDIIESSFNATAVEVVKFNHTRGAIERLKSEKFDMIFIDINILSIDENAVSKFIAKITQIPVVSLTSVSLNSIDFVEDGANIVGHLKKPISKLELFKLVLKHLNSELFILKEQENFVAKNLFKDIDGVALKEFSSQHQKAILKLYKKAEITNDLGAIKHFSEELFKLSYNFKIKHLENFATELLSKIELFDIETIHTMMQEYKGVLKRIESL